MIKITDFLPKESPVVAAIYDWHKKRGDAEPFRGYLGASEIGHPCERYLWYKFRGCCKEDISGRAYRLFQTGHLAEPRFVEELRGIGCQVHDVDSNGNQFVVHAHGGHFSGHMDGAILGVPGAEKTWHVGEFKTHKQKSFAKLVKDGSVKKSKEQHYSQMQVYMGLNGLKRALYLAVNKDTDELYAERIHFDKAAFDLLMERALRIITTNTPPARLSERPDWYECGWCSAHDLCHGTAESSLPIPAVNCRQCCHATPVMDGNAAWTCGLHGRGLCGADQDKACDGHLILPGLMYGCEPNDYGGSPGSDWIEYIKEDGELFRHGRGKGEFSTEELRKLPLSTISGKSLVSAAKSVMGATVEGYSQDDILSRFPESSTIWSGAACEVATEWKNRYGEDLDLGDALGTIKDTDYNAIEMPGGRTVIHKLPGSKQCEIRETELCK